jgi:hypothetical protein
MSFKSESFSFILYLDFYIFDFMHQSFKYILTNLYLFVFFSLFYKHFHFILSSSTFNWNFGIAIIYAYIFKILSSSLIILFMGIHSFHQCIYSLNILAIFLEVYTFPCLSSFHSYFYQLLGLDFKNSSMIWWSLAVFTLKWQVLKSWLEVLCQICILCKIPILYKGSQMVISWNLNFKAYQFFSRKILCFSIRTRVKFGCGALRTKALGDSQHFIVSPVTSLLESKGPWAQRLS